MLPLFLDLDVKTCRSILVDASSLLLFPPLLLCGWGSVKESVKALERLNLKLKAIFTKEGEKRGEKHEL